LFLSGKNIPYADIVRAGDLNTYQIMRAKNILMCESAINLLKEKLA
jgi:ribosomal protein L4